MSLRPPSSSELSSIADRFGFKLSDVEQATYHAMVAGAIPVYELVARLHAEQSAAGPGSRTHSVPFAEENELGAWYVRTDIASGDTGTLSGKRVAVKDNIAVAGVPMMNGSRTVEGYVPRYDATVVTRLLDAGATVAGKAVCESLCFSGASHTADTGPVRNPWDPTRTSGGSSSGSGALVAAGQVDLALGGDQGGSIRIPSAFCGIVGHKPTFGLVPYTGAFPIEQTIDHLGPMARTVSDVAEMLSVIAGYDGGRDPRQPRGLVATDYVDESQADVRGLRVGVIAEGFGHQGLSDPAVDATVRNTIRWLTELGLDVEEVSIPWHRHGAAIWNVIATDGAVAQMLEGSAYGYNFKGWYDPELMAHYGEQRLTRAQSLSVTTKLVALTGRHMLDTTHGRYYAMAQNLVPVLRQAYDDALTRFDVLVMPTLPIIATEIPDAGADLASSISRALEMIVNTAPSDCSGHPATSVPAGLVDGLPVGLMIIGRHFEDGTCLAVARAVEELAGGFPTPPGT